MVAALLAVPVGPAVGDDGTDVVIRATGPGEVSLSLVAADDGRFAYVEAGTDLYVVRTGQFPVKVWHDSQAFTSPGTLFSLQGDVLRWSEVDTGGSVMHTADLGTGARTSDSTSELVTAWTPDGWIGYHGGVLTQHQASGEENVLLKGISLDGEIEPRVVSDGDRTMVLYNSLDAHVTTQHLKLVADDGSTVTTLSEAPFTPDGRSVSNIVLTPNSEVWSTFSNMMAPEGGEVHRRERGRAEVSTYASPGSVVAATDEEFAVSYSHLFHSPPPPAVYGQVWSGDGTSWTRQQLPGASPIAGFTGGLGGVMLSGSTFVAGLGGNAGEETGIYALEDDGTPSRVFTPQAEPGVFTDVTLSGGELYYAQAETGSAPGDDTALFARTVTRNAETNQLSGISAQRTVGITMNRPVTGSTSALSLSAGRLLVRRRWPERAVFQMFFTGSVGLGGIGRGTATARAGKVKQSGAYSLTNGLVHRADRSAPLMSTGTNPADLYGAQVIWRSPAGKVMARNVLLEKKPRVLVPRGAAGPVAVWGSRYAWLTDAGDIRVRDLSGGTVRSVSAGQGTTDVRLNENTLSFTAPDGTIKLLDLSVLNSTPTDAGLAAPYQVDEDLLAGLREGEIHVRELPFGAGPRRPRLLDNLSPSSLAIGATWSASFDVTKPVKDAQLRIRRNGKIVRTLLPDGTGRDETGASPSFSWDGLTGGKMRAGAGDYRWTLTAEATDGDGALTAEDGQSAVTGIISLR